MLNALSRPLCENYDNTVLHHAPRVTLATVNQLQSTLHASPAPTSLNMCDANRGGVRVGLEMGQIGPK